MHGFLFLFFIFFVSINCKSVGIIRFQESPSFIPQLRAALCGIEVHSMFLMVMGCCCEETFPLIDIVCILVS